ncbi:MAG TPA: FAD-binding oxidoreductase [Marmoricola sp.]|nr:FAD-binding oxidoreductase [Marmoricola sp.]
MGGFTTTHEQAVARLRASYAAIPADQPVRLAKKTSNLFRPRGQAAAGLQVADLSGVIEVDPDRRTAQVQGMCTYEDLVAATLPSGLMPLVVPQLRTITLGGAVTGLGIESTSFRNGLPHESVLELEVLTGAGELITATPNNEHADLFHAFPNSYGSLGYATRLQIELEPIAPRVRLRHLRFTDLDRLARAVADICDSRTWAGIRVDGLDGVMFQPGEAYLSLATWTDEPGVVSDYTGSQIYYRSLQQRETDLLTAVDYLWRWDTDWFWCSGAFGLHHPWVRRLWPRRYRRSDVYHRLVGWDRRLGIVDRLDRRAGRPQRERVIQDIEVGVEELPEFLAWFDERVGMRPVWLCPLRLREPAGPGSAAHWTSYPLRGGTTYVNVGFWGTVPVGPDAPSAPTNRAIEQKVHELGGHKSLYSEAFYDPETFAELYQTKQLDALRDRYDPGHRLLSLYEKAVKQR